MSTTVRSSVKAQVFGAQNVTETLKPPTLSNRIQALSEEAEDTDILGDIEIKIEKDGKVLQYGKHPMKSFVANFISILYGLLKPSGGTALSSSTLTTSPSITKPDGTTANAYVEDYPAGNYSGGTPMACLAPANDSSYGIVVGSGTNAVTISDYKLASQIVQGTGAGQLIHNASSVSYSVDTSVTPAVLNIALSRTFTNSSGGSINITEVGIIARTYWKYATASIVQDIKYLIARDLLPTTYTVPNGASANVIITIKVVLV
jgi:hypothetical protein